MSKQALVIGLGRCGMSLVQALVNRGIEVLAVDRNADRVEYASTHATEAVALDATAEDELQRVRPADRDLCICAIGDDSSEASILCTALLRQLGAPRVVARANSPLQARILKLVGAHEVVNPLEDFGKRFADYFAFERLKGELPLGDDLVIAEIALPADLAGRTLAEAKLPARHSLTVVATREGESGEVKLPSPDQRLVEGSILVVVGRRPAVMRFVGRDE